MNAVDKERAGFWDHLLAVAEAIDASAASLEELDSYLLVLEEGFADTLDPADHYSEYVTILLCRSVRRRLVELTVKQAERSLIPL